MKHSLPWTLQHVSGPQATVRTADGLQFTVTVAAKRHQDLEPLVKRLIETVNAEHMSHPTS